MLVIMYMDIEVGKLSKYYETHKWFVLSLTRYVPVHDFQFTSTPILSSGNTCFQLFCFGSNVQNTFKRLPNLSLSISWFTECYTSFEKFFFLSWPRTLNIYLFCRPWHKYVAVGFFCLQIIEVSLLSCKCLYLSRFQTIHRKIRVYKNKSQRKFVRRLNMWLSARGTSRNSNYELQMPNRSSMKI